MPVTRAQVVAAVEQYLPRTANYSASKDLGNRDPVSEFSRIQQVVITGLATDPDAIFYLIYVASQRLLAKVRTTIGTLESIIGTGGLRAVSGNAPHRVDNLAALRASQRSLVRLSSGVSVSGKFSDPALASLRSDMSAFMTNELAQSAAASSTKTDAALRSLMADLKIDWDRVLTDRGSVFSALGDYTALDVRVLMSKAVTDSVNEVLRGLIVSIPSQSTEEQVASAEAALVSLAAADAALALVGTLPPSEGTIIVPPAEGGATAGSYLLLESLGATQGLLPLLRGTDGKLRLTGPAAGAPFTSISGVLTPPGAGTLSDRMTDPLITDFVASGIAAGMYLTLVDLGKTVEIATVSPNLLTFTPKVFYDPSATLRYAVTDHPPGEFFQSPSTDFWRDLVSSSTASTLVTGGASGGFVRVDKISGTDLTNSLASGIGDFRVPKLAGPGSSQVAGSTLFTSSIGSPGLLSNLVDSADTLWVTGANAPTNPHAISSVDSENDMTMAVVWPLTGIGSWHIEGPNTASTLTAVGESLLTSLAQGGDVLRVYGAQAGDYLILTIDSQETIIVDTATFTAESGASWEVLSINNNKVASPTETFSTAAVGDKLIISGTTLDDGEYDITFVGDGYVEIQQSLSGASFSGASFSVHEKIYSRVSDTFYKTDGGDLLALGVAPTMDVVEVLDDASVTVPTPIVLEVAGSSYSVAANLGANSLQLDLLEGVGSFTAATTFSDPNATWVADGVDPTKHELVVLAGVNSVTAIPIASVDSDTQLTLASTATLASDETYAIYPKLTSAATWEVRTGDSTRHFFDTTGLAPFVAAEKGRTLVLSPGTPQEERFAINSISSTSEVWLSGYTAQGAVGVPYAILDVVEQGSILHATGGSYPVVAVVDAHTLQLDIDMAIAPGKNIVWSVTGAGDSDSTHYVYDPAGAARLDAVSGFTDAMRGLDVYFMAATPVRGTFQQAHDPGADGFGEGFRVDVAIPLGAGKMSYRLMGSPGNQSNVFDTSSPTPVPSPQDFLSVWGEPLPLNVLKATSSASSVALTISPPLPSKLVEQSYVVVRGGSPYHGSYLLAEHYNSVLSLDADTADLRARVAEVLLDHGAVEIPILTGATASVQDVEGGVNSSRLQDLSSDMSSVLVGDKVTVGLETSYVSSVLSATSLTLVPSLAPTPSTSWSIVRTSVSGAILEANRLLLQMRSLETVLSRYSAGSNATAETILSLLVEHSMGRALSLIYRGRVAEFIGMKVEDGSYATKARVGIQATGATVFATRGVVNRANGLDPITGRSVSLGNGASSRYSSAEPERSVTALVSMAEGVADLRDDELTASLLSTTVEEQRNRAIYMLSGEVESGYIGDEDPTLPWVDQTGSTKTQLADRLVRIRDSLQYMIDHPDEFDEVPAVGGLTDAVTSTETVSTVTP